MSLSDPRPTVSTTAMGSRPPALRAILSLELLLQSVTNMDNTNHSRYSNLTSGQVCCVLKLDFNFKNMNTYVDYRLLSFQSQCHGSTGHCWCVDNSGQERQGTRTSAGTPTTDCSRPGTTQAHGLMSSACVHAATSGRSQSQV